MPSQRQLLTIAALAECLAGLALMVTPDAGVTLLLGAEPDAVGLMVRRIAGVALLALGIADAPAKNIVVTVENSGYRKASQ